MQNTITCPNCSHENPSNHSVCENCGMNLAVAATIAEMALARQFSEPQKVPISPELLVPRLGDYLVERGLVTTGQLERALELQKRLNESGDYSLLGQILVREELIDQVSLDTAITEQIFLLQEALRKSNNELEQRVRERTLQLQQALEKLTELNQLKTNFVSNISHELRTPLAHMIGYIELLKDEALGPLTREQVTAADVLAKSYNRLYGLIDELIQFSMLSQGEMTIYQKAVLTDKLLENAVSHPSQIASEMNVKIDLQNQAKDITVYADLEKISWVLSELIENAVKFNRPGGKVIVKLSASDGMVQFQVADNGIGISAEHLEEIFEAFHQLDGSSTRKVGGTGIGLTLAKQIVEAHGSKLNVQSVANKGSSFEFYLPQV